MGIQKDIYNKRLNELESLLKKSQSQTSKALLQEAIQQTKQSFAECERIAGLTKDKIIFYDDAKKKFDVFMVQMNEATARIKATANVELLSQDTKDKILVAGEAMAGDIRRAYDTRVNANRMIRSATEQCGAELSRTLLELIFKPDSSSFTADAVFSILGKIVTGFIPYSDKVEMLLEANIKNRKRQYLSSGDKLLVYLEDYIAVVNAWLLLNEQFEKEVLS